MPQSLIELLPTAPSASGREAIYDTPPVEIGDQLKGMFDRLTSGPMPKRLIDLADALEEAFQRGELFDAKACAKPGQGR